MKEYKVYFTIYGKKLMKTVIASSKQHAENEIKNSITFNKIEEVEMAKDISDLLKMFGDIFK